MIYRDDIPLEVWKEKFGITGGDLCLHCNKELKNLRPFIMKEYAGVMGQCDCGYGPTSCQVPISEDKIKFWNEVLR